MSFNWDDDTALRLIDKFHDNELLWNPGHPDYKNRHKRTEGLRMLASLFGADSNEIERKIKNLTSHYYREKKKLDETRKAGLEDVREPKWFAYKALDFLRVKYSDNNSGEMGIYSRTPLASPGYFTGPSPGQSNLSSNDANSEPQDSLYTLDTDFKSVFKAE
ncbi:Uncharacterized protein OBRU01_02236 [Operophtera brumata]|uniref:MADF domain-containing protein n=1 Tax=Operophtera brumata TaxID=104452 RepID=A0A0L7LQF9_OPEBR|nr:Uncharacterized protein OBRU01_02236 [Operophtera brumata]